MEIKLIHKEGTRTALGNLSKGWYNLDGKRVMVKGNSYTHYEPYSEVMCYRLSKLLEIPYTLEYWLMPAELFPEVSVHQIEHVCVCVDFAKPREVESGFRKYIDKKYEGAPVDYKKLLFEICHPSYLFYTFVLDAIIGNEDRHLNNISVLESKGKVRPAPIYDFGASLLAGKSDFDIEKYSVQEYFDDCKPFKETHDEQMKLFIPYSAPFKRASLEEAIRVITPVLELLNHRRSKAIIEYLTWRWQKYVLS